MGETRKIAAILVSDVVGYSRLTGADEDRILARLRTLRSDLIDPTIAVHRGRVVKRTGDGSIIEFRSVVDAVNCAIEVQRAMIERNAGVAPDNRIQFRIGIHLGDVVEESDGDLMGDGVNIAARLEAIAKPGSICLSEDAYRQVRSRINLPVSDLGPAGLKNIAEPIRVFAVEIAPAMASPESTTGPLVPETGSPRLSLPDKPSIAVLPFQNMSADEEQEYFADGMVEEIITALSRIRWLFVIARNSSFVYKGKAIDIKQVGRELGVRYVLEGSVRRAGQKVRITGQLIDTLDGTHLWADRFDGSLEDIFDLQDSVAISVAGAIEPTLQAAEIRRSSNRPTRDLNAYDLYLRALPLWRSLERSDLFDALKFIEEAIGRDPRFGPALALAAICRHHMDINGWTESVEGNRRIAIDLARRAILVAGDDPDVLAYSGFSLAFFGEEIGSATALIDRALKLNSNFARGWFWSGWVRLYAGDTETAARHFAVSIRLSPRDRWAIHLTGLGIADFFEHRFDEAIANLRLSLEEIPSHATTYRFLAASYAHTGRYADAREILGRLRSLTSVVMPTLTNFRRPEHRELLLSGLRLAEER
jgi:adenylate cyclase